jgi:hypothetical protein
MVIMVAYTEAAILMGIFFGLAYWGYMSTITPTQFVVLNPISFGFMAAQIGIITAGCVVVTGLPCVAVLTATFILNLLFWIFSLQTLVQILVMTPLTVVILYILMRLAKGGG